MRLCGSIGPETGRFTADQLATVFPQMAGEGGVSDNPRCSLGVLVAVLRVISLVVNSPCKRGGRSRRGNFPFNSATGHSRTGRLARGSAVLEAGLLGVDWRRA